MVRVSDSQLKDSRFESSGFNHLFLRNLSQVIGVNKDIIILHFIKSTIYIQINLTLVNVYCKIHLVTPQ
jgi:hypothetical protein